MKILSTILILFLAAACVAQQPTDPDGGYFPIKGDGYFLMDANGNIITDASGGILSIIRVEDTTATNVIQPPDSLGSFSINVGGVGEPFTSLLREIRSYWTLEEAAGNAVDSVETADLPVYGSVTRQQTGKIGDCYSFITNGYLGNIDSYYEFDDNFTVSCWTKTTSADNFMVLMSNFSSSNYGYDLKLSSGILYWDIRGGSGLTTTISGGGDLRDNAWHHVAASLGTDDSLKIYVDGVLVSEEHSSHGTAYDSDCQFEIGSRNQGHFYDGFIDEPAVWNRELTQGEIDSLVAEVQYPFSGEGSGGDSLRMLTSGYDSRADSARVQIKLGEWPTDEDDGTNLFAFPLEDSSSYLDTTFAHNLTPKDTTWYARFFTGTDPEDNWVYNSDTTLLDSTDRTPPPQDFPGIWDTVVYVDFEEYTEAPIYWNRNLWLTQEISPNGDNWDAWSMNGEPNWRAEDFRAPQWFQDNIDDSIVIDPITDSKVLRLMYAGGYHDGYDGQSGRGGEFWTGPIPSAPYTELYFSINILLNPDFMQNTTGGGKIGPWIMGGTYSGHQGQQYYGEGFSGGIMWDYHLDRKGALAFYWYDQDTQGVNTPGRWMRWDNFQPTGGGLTADMYDNPYGAWMWPDSDSVWVNITVRIVTNTHTGSTNNENGILEGYINGRLIEQVSGMNLITYPDIGNEIHTMRFYQAFGGGTAPMPIRDEWTLNDDYCVFTYDEEVEDIPRGNELSQPGRILNLPNWPKTK